MNLTPEIYGIIPARYASTRFEGKPLADILGKPMFWHVYHCSSQCKDIKKIILATDDERIFDAANKFSVPVVMTKKEHPSGTDRILEAAEILKLPLSSVIINIQGDEPALNPEMLNQLISPFKNEETKVSTLARKISKNEAENPNLVKVVFSKSGKALYFSRSMIPFYRESEGNNFYGHIGLYAFRMEYLKKFTELGESSLEKAEKLEQLRLLENDIPITVVITSHISIGVDKPEDLIKVTKILQAR
ncbi:MAG: 3-deoxy-manno-octulosonate cytidylyltransferase [Desulfobacterales bacterium]|nr:3-deoxy-manno-octulosonate cytidylyltransferase [Desulfobacterales bacterium]